MLFIVFEGALIRIHLVAFFILRVHFILPWDVVVMLSGLIICGDGLDWGGD